VESHGPRQKTRFVRGNRAMTRLNALCMPRVDRYLCAHLCSHGYLWRHPASRSRVTQPEWLILFVIASGFWAIAILRETQEIKEKNTQQNLHEFGSFLKKKIHSDVVDSTRPARSCPLLNPAYGQFQGTPHRRMHHKVLTNHINRRTH